jgi:hypothetical protein
MLIKKAKKSKDITLIDYLRLTLGINQLKTT